MGDAVLQGSLASFRLPDVLTFLAMSRKSGTLVLMNGVRGAQVLFTNGSVVYASSNQDKLRLSAILLRKRKITSDQFTRIDDIMTSDTRRFGQLALEQGVMNEEQLRDSLKIQVSEVLYDAFVWTSGSFSFAEELQLPAYAVTIAVDLPNLIMEGARRIQEWEQCIQLYPENTVIFRVVSAPKDDKVTLTAQEWKILFLINGQRTLEDLVRDAGEDALSVYRVVYGLQGNKLIEVARPAAAPVEDTMGAERQEETMRQMPPVFHSETTVADQLTEDTKLLISTEGRLSYSDVASPVVAQLVFSPNGAASAAVVPLTDSEYLVGRQAENNIKINDLGVSGFHARIFRGAEGYVIEDLKSRNGVYINGTKVIQSSLRNGDTVRLGATDVRYEVLIEPKAR
ncbi:MAG TPA: DUF4388 domain-containing protein [Thermoanaerobaculia bacterium]|nr:DUF4388 domain-containing protein [Thermoanaerobaculia bacterium]